MEVMFDRVAGLDVGKESVTVCLRTPGVRGRRHAETRTFKTTFGVVAGDAGLAGRGRGEIAAMESTSTYWKPPFYCLEEVMEVWLLNAAHMKAVPGRKSDVRDAEWIAQLLGAWAAGAVVRAAAGDSPAADADPVPDAADGRPDPGHDPVGADVGRRLDQIVLGRLLAEHGVGAGDAGDAMIDGETDPLRLAELARGKMRRKIPDLAQALTGTFDAHHAQLARSMLGRLDLVEQALAELDAVIAEACQPWAASDRVAADHSRGRAEGRAGDHR